MKVDLVQSVKSAVDYIINKEGYRTFPEIEVTRGSQEGDGYASKTYAITIKSKNEKDNNGKSINLFVKYLPEEIENVWQGSLKEAFYLEYKFYSEVFPTLDQFQKSKNIKEPFNNVPKHYNTKVTNGQIPPIVLENLRNLGYTLRDRKKPVDDLHLELPIKTFAKYHAISFAMKDQEPEKFKKLTDGVQNVLGKSFETFGMDVVTKKLINQFIEGLDPVLDKKMIECCKNLDEELSQRLLTICNTSEEYSVLGQGDCWSNNMMFLYDNKTDLPIDVKLIDWQFQIVGSPLLDFSYYFYTLATKRELDNAEYYLKLYYDTLSQRITELGSDPEKVYPQEIFRKHWKKYAAFGLCMAFSIIKAQLLDQDEIPNSLNSESPMAGFTIVIRDQNVYINRMKDIVQYFINHDLL